MSNPSAFSNEEFDILCQAPGSLAVAVVAADTGGFISSVKEIAALAKAIAAGASHYPDNTLVQQVHAALHSEEEIKSRMERKKTSTKKGMANSAEVLEVAYEFARKVNEILETKMSLQDTFAYRQWIMGIAQATAEAAKEGGFLGIGGKLVSKKEQNYLDELAVILKVQ